MQTAACRSPLQSPYGIDLMRARSGSAATAKSSLAGAGGDMRESPAGINGIHEIAAREITLVVLKNMRWPWLPSGTTDPSGACAAPNLHS